MSVYIEHSAGNFPMWLAPTQISGIPVRDTHDQYAKEIFDKLKIEKFRVELADSKTGLGKSVRAAKNMKQPCWIVVGDSEMESKTVTLESREGEKINISLEDLMLRLNSEVASKK